MNINEKERNFNADILLKYFELERNLIQDTEKSIEMKSAMIWGAIYILLQTNVIDENLSKKFYGVFMLNIMGLRK